METRLPETVKSMPEGRQAAAIIGDCVHCGFCLATCPSYRVLGDERDSPRGRIYLIKTLLEKDSGADQVRRHLDRCLTCRNCETTCPSGVKYGELLDIGRLWLEQQHPMPRWRKILSGIMVKILTSRRFMRLVADAARISAPMLPRTLSARFVPDGREALPWPGDYKNKQYETLAQEIIRFSGQAKARTEREFTGDNDRSNTFLTQHENKMAFAQRYQGKGTILWLEGCIQAAWAPHINALGAKLFQQLGYRVERMRAAHCCGAMAWHLSQFELARAQMKATLDACKPWLDQDNITIINVASGCMSHLKSYKNHFKHDSHYAALADRFSSLTRDPAEMFQPLANQLKPRNKKYRLAFQSPCTLQHGQGLSGVVEQLLRQVGHDLITVDEAYLCCGSSGTYSLLHPRIAAELGQKKVTNIQHHDPECIATANIGCQLHLAAKSRIPVYHYIQLIRAS